MTPNMWVRILLVDDDPSRLTIIKAGLDDAGHDVTACPSIDDAMVCGQREPFAVAVLNVHGPRYHRC